MAKTIWGLLVALMLLWVVAPLPGRAEPQPATVSITSTSSIQREAADLQRGSPIEIARIRSGLFPGVVIGGHYEGVLKVLRERYTASGRLDEQLEEAIRRLLEDALERHGYSVSTTQGSSVFEDQLIDESEPGRFLLGGTITQTSLNSYSFMWKELTREQRTVRWEVFDRERGKIIYRHETEGNSESDGINNPAATYAAIKDSFQKLLAEPDFETAIAPSVAVDPYPTITQSIEAIPSSNEPLPVESIAGRSIPSIVRIRTSTGRGTGFLLSSNGLVATNHHVVGSAFSVKVDLYDGSTQTGRVIKRDAFTDVALLKLEGETPGISGLPICQSDAVKVGETVVAIGNPLSYSNSVTQGVVSGFRSIGDRDLIQTDAAINPGNSGGPLFNRYGAVVGIVTEKVASRGVEGLGFALPIGASLQRLNVQIHTPQNAKLDRCGNPV